MTGRAYRFRRRTGELWTYNKFRVVLTSLSLLFLVIVFWNQTVIPIYPGHQGVMWSRFFGGTNLQRTYHEGTHVILPFNRMYVYDVRVQEIEGSVELLSVNGLTISVDYAARFHPSLATLPQLHQDIGPEYIKNLVVPEAIHSLRAVIGNYTPEQIWAQDEEGLLAEIDSNLEQALQDYVVLDDMLLRRLMLPDRIQNAIQDKLEQEQVAMAYKYRLQREVQEQQRKVIEAKGIQQFELIAGIPILQWRGIEATVQLATSENAKIIVIGTSASGLPIILNTQQ